MKGVPHSMDTVVVTSMEGLTTVVTWLNGQFSSMIDTIVAEPLLLLSVGIFALGAVIGLAHRLIRG